MRSGWQRQAQARQPAAEPAPPAEPGGGERQRRQLSDPSRSQQYSSRHSATSSSQRPRDNQGSTASSACSSATPALNASSPRRPAAILSASRRLSPSAGNAFTRKSLLAIGVPTSSEACQAASIDRSCSSRSSTALA